MTNLEALQQLIKALGLKKVEGRIWDPGHSEYSESTKKEDKLDLIVNESDDGLDHDELDYEFRYTLGSGDGYAGFVADFYFNKNGNLIKHCVWE